METLNLYTLSTAVTYVTSVNLVFFVSDKIINNSDNFRMKCWSYSKISAISYTLYFLFKIKNLTYNLVNVQRKNMFILNPISLSSNVVMIFWWQNCNNVSITIGYLYFFLFLDDVWWFSSFLNNNIKYFNIF